MAADTTGLSTVAGRYASALLDLADEAGEPGAPGDVLDRVAGDLRALKALMAENKDLSRVIKSPVMSRADQERALEAVLKAAGAHDLTRRLVAIAARNRRLFLLSAIIDAFLDALARRRGEIAAEVTTARALSDQQMDRLTEALKRAVGKNVKIDLRIDPGVIGGLIVRVGSRMVDSSLKTKLQELQFAMKGIG